MRKEWLENIKTDVYIRTLINLIQLLIVPSVCLFVLYFTSSRVLMQREQESMKKVAVECTEKLENELESITAVSSYIAKNPQILKYLHYYSMEDASPGRILDAQSVLESLTVALDNIVLVQVYANASETLIDQDTCAQYLERYYGTFSVQGMQFAQWHQFLKNQTSTVERFYNLEMFYAGKRYETWMISYRIPQYSLNEKYGQLLVYIDKQKLCEEFSALEYRQGKGYLAVMEADGTLMLLDNASDIRAELIAEDICEPDALDSVQMIRQQNRKLLVTKSYSRELQSYVVLAVPKEYIYAPIRGINILLVIMITVIALVSAMLLVLIARKLTGPYFEIHHLLNTKSASAEELLRELSGMVECNKELKKEVMSSIPSMKTAALYNLLLGGYETRTDMEKGIELLGIDKEAKQYGLLILCMRELKNKVNVEEISMLQAILGKAIEHDISVVQGIYFPDYERVVVLCALYEESTTAAEVYLQEKMEKQIYQFFQQNQINVVLAGDVAEHVTDFPSMFFRAQFVLNYHAGQKQNAKICWYSREFSKVSSYNYPPEMEKRLGNFMLMGNVKGLTEAFDDLKMVNAYIFEHHKDEEISRLLWEIYWTLCRKQKEFRMCDGEQLEKKKREILHNLKSGERLMQTFYLLEEAFYLGIDQNGELWQDQNKELSERIHLYLCQNYQDPQLCLSAVAERFSITESYLSRLYKQAFGQTCNKAIETLRMEDAALQLTQGRSVACVAESVGYHSVQVFRRVYKKHFQEIPSRSKKTGEQKKGEKNHDL